MATLKQLPEDYAATTLGTEERFGVTMMGTLGRWPRTTPMPQGPISAELDQMLLRVVRSLAEVDTVRSYFRGARNQYWSFFGLSEKSDEASLDYLPIPPTRTHRMDTRFFIRGRGKPKPYSLEDE